MLAGSTTESAESAEPIRHVQEGCRAVSASLATQSRICWSLWTLVPGDSHSLFATDFGYLVQLNPRTYGTEANYSSLLPAGVSIQSVFVDEARLYLGGELEVATGGATPFFGFINTKSNTETTLSSSASNNPSYLSGGIFSIAKLSGKVYFGGGLDFAETSPALLFTFVEGYLFQYSPYSGKVTNLSSVNPVTKWSVFAMFNTGSTIVMTIGDFYENSMGITEVGGTYSLAASHHRLINDSATVGSHLAALLEESSVTAGTYFIGGVNTARGEAETVALPTWELSA